MKVKEKFKRLKAAKAEKFEQRKRKNLHFKLSDKQQPLLNIEIPRKVNKIKK